MSLRQDRRWHRQNRHDREEVLGWGNPAFPSDLCLYVQECTAESPRAEVESDVKNQIFKGFGASEAVRVFDATIKIDRHDLVKANDAQFAPSIRCCCVVVKHPLSSYMAMTLKKVYFRFRANPSLAAMQVLCRWNGSSWRLPWNSQGRTVT